MKIPWSRLPPGFAKTVQIIPDDPVTPRQAATVVLMRDGPAADHPPEILLVRRVRASAFIPGAWVFPGGRVDESDRADAAMGRWHPSGAGVALADRLDVRLDEAAGFLNAALRECLEETGIGAGLMRLGGPADDREMTATARSTVRRRLLRDELDWARTLDALDAHVDVSRIAYIGHWVTPIQEPRRYDTRFFLAAVSRRAELDLSEFEMNAGSWLPAEDALRLHRRGELPMVFPTIRTVESLADLPSVGAALDHFAEGRIPRILPRLIAEEDGVRMVID
ncbi:MAG TPA: NUDIX hydrolase [Longimicrobiales bacterium]|nr:NUDIX hydrolase [Longimicrobiales bacterium]